MRTKKVCKEQISSFKELLGEFNIFLANNKNEGLKEQVSTICKSIKTYEQELKPNMYGGTRPAIYNKIFEEQVYASSVTLLCKLVMND